MLRVYTDGSTSNNGQEGARGSVGVYFGAEDPRNVSEPFQNRIESKVRAARDRTCARANRSDKPAVIVTDSKYAIGCLTQWCVRWRDNGFKTSAESL